MELELESTEQTLAKQSEERLLELSGHQHDELFSFQTVILQPDHLLAIDKEFYSKCI